jgi:hypothetical protein
MNTQKCRCEHEAHFDRTKRTPFGNPGHEYGVSYAEPLIQTVKTTWGTFQVCPDCAKDCLQVDRSRNARKTIPLLTKEEILVGQVLDSLLQNYFENSFEIAKEDGWRQKWEDDHGEEFCSLLENKNGMTFWTIATEGIAADYFDAVCEDYEAMEEVDFWTFADVAEATPKPGNEVLAEITNRLAATKEFKPCPTS